MARIPFSDNTIHEMLYKAAERADVILSNISIEYVTMFQLLVTFTMTSELGLKNVAVSGMYYLDDKDELQTVFYHSMTQWTVPNAN